MTHQTLLLNSDRVTFTSSVALNPATPTPNPDFKPPAHDCQQILAEDQGWQKDLSDRLISNAKPTWFTDGSSYLVERQHKAGEGVGAIMDRRQVV